MSTKRGGMTWIVLWTAACLVLTGCQQNSTPVAGQPPAEASTLETATSDETSAPVGDSNEPPAAAPAPGASGEALPDEAASTADHSTAAARSAAEPAEPADTSAATDPPPAEAPTNEPAAEPSVDEDGEPAADSAAPAENAENPAADAAENNSENNALAADPDALPNPFRHRVAIPDFPRDLEWLNTSGPLRKQDLQGKFVILDFWTYCCINCIHILPELKKLERAYPDELVVIGVHSAKFETEKGTENIKEAILRYEIEHPVVNDAEHLVWDTFGVRSWPTILLIDPEGNAVWGKGGEVEFETLDEIMQLAIPYYKQEGLLDETPIKFDLLAERQKPTPLRFPGKVLADEDGQRLFITDSNHNRIVITSLAGELLETIGSGAIGSADGGYDKASFDHPQGLALHGDTLYVSDTENHMLRKIDLQAKQVTTIAGTGKQRRDYWPGIDVEAGVIPERFVSTPSETALNSPWALWVHEADLYIAMAGPHQIWKMTLDETEIGPYAGNGREDIVDGLLLPPEPYQKDVVDPDSGLPVDPPQTYSAFAQPSGLASDGKWLFVADSEGSSIRAVPFDPNDRVRTVVGTAHLPFGRLFEFGDQDGEKEQVLLQHCLGVAYDQGQIYVADTYNNKIKVVDAETGATRTLAGTGEPGLADEPAQFDEPAGISLAGGVLFVADTNNHAIRTVEISTGKVGTLVVEGLKPPTPPAVARQPDFSKATQVAVEAAKVKPVDGAVTLRVKLQLPAGWKMNPLAPARYWLLAEDEAGPVTRAALGRRELDEPTAEFDVKVKVDGTGQDTVKLAMNYYYCQESGGGLCKVGSVQWTLPLAIDPAADSDTVNLQHEVR